MGHPKIHGWAAWWGEPKSEERRSCRGEAQSEHGVYLADRLRRRSLQRRGESEFEEFAEAFGLLAGDGDFGLLFVVHLNHEAGFEPGNDFLDVMDIHQVGAVGAPEGIGVEGGVEFFEGAALRGAFDIAGNDGDEAAFDRGENEVAGIHQKHALLGLDEDFGGRSGGGFGGGELGDEAFETLGGAGVGFDFFFGFLDGFGDAGFVEGFQYVVDGVDVEGLHGVLVECGGEDNVRDFELALDEPFEDAEAVEAGHLDIEEEQVGGMLLDEVDGFEAVFALGEEIDFGEGFEEEGEFLASGLFVVDDDGVDGHGRVAKSSIEGGRSEWQLREEIGNRRSDISDQEAREGLRRVRRGRRVHREEEGAKGAAGSGMMLWRRRYKDVQEAKEVKERT
jgi:hypothetical protein